MLLCKTFLETLIWFWEEKGNSVLDVTRRWNVTTGASAQRSLRTLLPLLGGVARRCPVWLQTKQRGFGRRPQTTRRSRAVTPFTEVKGGRFRCDTFSHHPPFPSVFSAPRHLGSRACLWVHVFFFLILEPSRRPCDKCIAPASLWLPSGLSTWWTHKVVEVCGRCLSW